MCTGQRCAQVYFKRDPGLSLSSYEDLLSEVPRSPPHHCSSGMAPPLTEAILAPTGQVRARLTVNGAPNVMPFRWFKETPHAAYLVRQYFHASLLERLSSPPFLSLVEKRWLIFQLLQALQQCHELEGLLRTAMPGVTETPLSELRNKLLFLTTRVQHGRGGRKISRKGEVLEEWD